MGDWPGHTLDGDGTGDNPGATSTLEQLKGAAGDGGGDGSDCAAFTDDFEGSQVGSQARTVYVRTVRRRRRAGTFAEEVQKNKVAFR